MEKKNLRVACSRRSDTGARAKNKARERAGKKRGETGEEDVSPRFFPALSLAIFFARAPLSERLEQANVSFVIEQGTIFTPFHLVVGEFLV